ncbi:hypothetical protein [Clostridium arbusti]|uniref:hypothetical protein n=1 Tax=Clostridium arbusti TaxID=1137848 RepID=UPI000288CF58|nr:hypothetical protein [Clostridium arbusti]
MNINNLNTLSIKEMKISNSILNWSFGRKNLLSIVAPPYNTALIFLKVIMEYISTGRRVIYITEECEKNIQIIIYLRNNTKFRKYTYLKNSITGSSSSLIFCNYKKAVLIKDKFDLVIYDDIRSYPIYSKYEIIDIMNKCCYENGKLIAYSIDDIFNKGKEMILPIKDNKMPLVEPRIITTRIDISKDMPFVVYEYIKWSINIGRRVAIILPNSINIFNVTSYVVKYCEVLTHNITYYSQYEKNINTIKEFHKYDEGVIVTDDFDSVCTDNNSINIMIFFADSNEFNYKKLVYFCGRTGEGDIGSRGEVICLAKEENYEIEKAKNITRNFNKKAWEDGLLSL